MKMRCYRSYLFIKLMLFLWPSLNSDHISVIEISQWHLFVVEPETSLSSFYFDKGIRPWMLILTLFFKSILNCLRFGIQNSMFGPKNVNMRDLRDTKRSWQRAHDKWREFIIIYGFDTIIGVREPNYGNGCLSMRMLVFKKNNVFE